MTIKEAIIKSLEEIKSLVNNNDVCNHIINNGYYDFKDAKTPASTVSALLGDFIRKGDTRVKRIKKSDGSFSYYLSKYENEIETSVLIESVEEVDSTKNEKSKSYEERDLHKLLATYLKSHNIFSKTIFHEKSNSKDKHQKWIHPDMVGVSYLKLQTYASQSLQKVLDRESTVRFNSYELKREISNDYELKEAFFQAVSNSSWANHGFLVAFDINDNLYDEIKRLNQSFGIGVIELSSNPYISKLLFPARYKDLDYRTIDKLCKINPDFERFILQIEKLITADQRYLNAMEKELEEYCDKSFNSEIELDNYCKEKNIPVENI
ncbi:MAG: hypothetical protein CFE25_13995 [Chitinophagaceae bacterium BSSC1]|jgi:hypothetical protein|nr:MAG: hypothetical protein CFE25_13995 [Chitinophagaceae bacterium BSSC1]